MHTLVAALPLLSLKFSCDDRDFLSTLTKFLLAINARQTMQNENCPIL